MQMRDVAARAEVALGTLYRHYTSKDQLLLAALAQQAGTLRERLDAPATARRDRGRTRLRRAAARVARARTSAPRDPGDADRDVVARRHGRGGEAGHQRDTARDHRRRGRRRTARRSRRHHAGARRGLVRGADVLEHGLAAATVRWATTSPAPRRSCSARSCSTRFAESGDHVSAAAPRIRSSGLRLREPRQDQLGEQVDVLGVRRVDGRQDRPLRAAAFQRLQPLGDPHRSAVHDLGSDPARARPSRPRGRRRGRAGRAHPTCASRRGASSATRCGVDREALDGAAPRVPPVGERDRLTDAAARCRRPTPDSRARRAACTAATSAATRSAIVPGPSPNASFSARIWWSPAPRPAINRPLLTRCTVSSAAASDAGGRRVARATSGPSCTRSVSAATAPSSAKHSSAPRRGGGTSRHMWS